MSDKGLVLVGRASCPSFLGRHPACPTKTWADSYPFRTSESVTVSGHCARSCKQLRIPGFSHMLLQRLEPIVRFGTSPCSGMHDRPG